MGAAGYPLDMVREAIEGPDLGTVACARTPTCTATDTGIGPSDDSMSTQLVQHIQRGVPHGQQMSVTGRFATSSATPPQMHAPVCCATRRETRIPPYVRMHLAVRFSTHMQTLQVMPCTKRMYTRMSFPNVMRMTTHCTADVARPSHRRVQTREPLRTAQRTHVCVRQCESAPGNARLYTQLDQRIDKRWDDRTAMCDDTRSSRPGDMHVGTESAVYAAMCLFNPLASDVYRRACRCMNRCTPNHVIMRTHTQRVKVHRHATSP